MSLDKSKFNGELWPSTRVRDTFVDFFCKKYAHQNIKSSAVVPYNDPTLLFTNSGMAQFKAVFLGQVDPTSPLAGVKRVANTQKCIRAGGKHNDLDDVGKDSYHHTFFEMLGSWSFGDYFKADAIDWAWELLTVVYGLPAERLYTTYFRGDEKNKIPRDDEARERWLKYLPADHVLPFGAKENFWEMGDTGPCGPCTEIHFDLKGGRNASNLVNADDPTVIEIWNLVFMQFQRNADTSLTPLPNKHVDTGAGLERFVGVLQNKMSNYETDLFTDLFAAIQEVSGDTKGYTNKYGAEDINSHDMAYRVVADHIRTLTFALSDGAVPDNEGRGYVLRRIVRRAVRYGTQVLKAPPGFFHKLVPSVVRKMSGVFPEIVAPAHKVTTIIKREEELFMRTLENGTKRLTKVLERLDTGASGKRMLAGAEMWDMYSTFGFPADLTELMCAERGVGVDKPGYEAASAAFRVQRNAGTSGAVAMPTLDMHGTDHLQKGKVPPTDDAPKYTPDVRSIDARVLALFQNGAFVDKLVADKSQYAGVILDRTNFYAEAGGQVADVGQLRSGGVDVFDIVDVQNYAGYILHVGRVRDGATPIAVGDTLQTMIDSSNRARVTSNHTTTHMLNWGLRRTCGTSVEQKGSKVVAELLRFDFSHDGAVGAERIAKVDALVNEIIGKNWSVFAQEVPIAAARAVNGLTAVFGEKYPDPVRMVTIGVPVNDLLATPGSDWGAQFSIEFCGGTHLLTSGLAGSYVTISEVGIAQGIRRIIGVTGAEAVAARDAAAAVDKRVTALEAMDQALPAAIEERLALQAELGLGTMPLVDTARARERLDALVRAALSSKKDRASEEKAAAESFIASTLAAHKTSPLPFVVANIPEVGGNGSAMLNITYSLTKHGIAACIVSAEPAGKKAKVNVVATCPADCKLAAGAWCQAAAAPFGGKGGGKADKGQGAHDQLDKAAETAAKASEFATAAMK